VVSFIGAAVVTHGEVRIHNAGNQYLDMIRFVFRRLGVTWSVEGEDILVPAKQRLKIEPDLGNAIPEIKSNVWPGFPTDLVSIAITVATQARAVCYSTIGCIRGACISLINWLPWAPNCPVRPAPGHCHRASNLYGEKVESPDIRAGMACCWRSGGAGKSTIRNIGQIDVVRAGG